MIIFIYGEDTFRSSQKLHLIKDKFLKEVDPSGVNFIQLDGAKLKFEDFNQEVKAAPFLARKRMVIIKNLISENKSKEIQKEVAQLIKESKLNETDQNIIVFWENTSKPKSKAKNALWDGLINEKLAEEFSLLKPIQINAWIKNEIIKQGATIDNEALNYLAATVGNDLWQMANEITKLVNYCGQNKIMTKDVEMLVQAKYDDDIFKLIDSIGNKNKKLALKLLDDQFHLGTNEMLLLTILIRHFRILMLIKDLQISQPVITKNQVSQELHIHPFVAQKTLAQVKNFTLPQLKSIYQKLLDIDWQIKTQPVKTRLLFELLIAQL